MKIRRKHPTSFEAEVERLRCDALARIDRIPIAALIWGPAQNGKTATSDVRSRLRDVLLKHGHLARFSEELLDPNSRRSNFAQQVAQAEAHDIVFSIPDSPGSIAEIHDFARIPTLAHKIVAFLDRQWDDGYSNQSLVQMQSVATCRIQTYDSSHLPGCVIDSALDMIGKLQEFYYIGGRRF